MIKTTIIAAITIKKKGKKTDCIPHCGTVVNNNKAQNSKPHKTERIRIIRPMIVTCCDKQAGFKGKGRLTIL